MVIDPPIVRVLKALEKELTDLIDSDILPRWKKQQDIVEKFLENQPHPHTVGVVAEATSTPEGKMSAAVDIGAVVEF